MDKPNRPHSPPQEDTGPSLRARLIAVGAELVAAEGVQALTLREIARRAGVSHGAPRRYFPTHLTLLSAIARQGFGELASHLAAETAGHPAEPRAQLDALARAYLGFARTHPGMYELMFRHDLLESGELGLRDTSLPLFRTLAGLIAQVRTRPDDDPAALAGALWANLHGIAQLSRWGSLQLATGTEDVGPLLRAALDAHLGPEPR
ncbi:TetR/AcrR family transcriptional regulator [Streptomyces sp. NPDC052496]|uniref:TetR/AcrR family transcriptional regulator n=1 Tax=Streptomyces sp. NPDC052496 TaxID=3154951 RepID=UPI00342786CE